MKTLLKSFSLFTLFSLSMGSFAQATVARSEREALSDLARVTQAQRFELVGGYGEQTDSYRIAFHWHLFAKALRKWDMEISLATNYSVFDGEEDEAGDPVRMRDLGITPTFTFYSHSTWQGFRPYIEGGIGFHYLTDKEFTAKDFSTNFQFGDHIGLGVKFGNRNHLRLAYQFQHLSNAGIREPNPGINFHHLNFGVNLK